MKLNTLLNENADPFKAALQTIARELVNELGGSSDPELIDDLLQGRWIEMLRDEINDLVSADQPYDATLMDPEANR